MRKDNSTFIQKVGLRRGLLKEFDDPFVLETHGGWGKIWQAAYADLPSGVVFEEQERKAEYLALQRPTWAVYQADCIRLIAGGACAGRPFNFIFGGRYLCPASAPDIDSIALIYRTC